MCYFLVTPGLGGKVFLGYILAGYSHSQGSGCWIMSQVAELGDCSICGGFILVVGQAGVSKQNFCWVVV